VQRWGFLPKILLQFMVMPFLSWGLTPVLPIAPELAVGIVLVGSISGGVAGNAMAYLARANVALSVSMTCVITLVAPQGAVLRKHTQRPYAPCRLLFF
jgi:BASS family bile acid:Na+ symporter